MTYTRKEFALEADEVAEEFYNAHGDDKGRLGRFHLAIRILLDSYQLEDMEIAEQVLDDHADLGIDYFAVFTGVNNDVYVIQVKDHKELGKAEQVAAVRKLIGEFRLLTEKSRIVAAWPERRKERFADFKVVRNDEHRVRYILVLTGIAVPESLELEITDLKKHESLDVLNPDDLAHLEEENREPKKPEVTVRIQKSKKFELNERGGAKTLVALVNGLDYVEATENHGVGIFRLNPRLYLGDRPSNKGMLTTLRDSAERERFHLLNNGITVVCETFDYTGDQLAVRDFQVVNGCQTTESLWKFKLEDEENLIDVYVPLRVIETRGDESLAYRISETTNSQSAVLSSDLVANDPCQKDIKLKLGGAETPIFYEARRGELRELKKRQFEYNQFRITPADWGQTTSQGVRVIGLKELAQVLLAATQSPSSAKEQISSLFGSRDEDSLYQKLFSGSWSDPIQLQLLIETYLYIRRPENWAPKGAKPEEAREYADLARLGRFYITYLVFRQWRDDYGIKYSPDDDEPELLPSEFSRDILSNFLDKLGRYPEIACKTLLHAKKQHNLETRPLLRQKANRTLIEASFSTIRIATAM